MIRWRQPMYLDDSIDEKMSVIRYKFKFKKYPGSYYYLILPEGSDMPEIIRAVYLKQSHYKKMNYDIIGVASDKSQAMELFRDMAQDAWNALGTPNIRRFFESCQQQ